MVLEQVAFDPLRTSGEGGVEPAGQHQEGLHASGFQGTITDKVTDAVVLGLASTTATTRLRRPIPSWPGHEDSPDSVAQPKWRLIWNWPDVERSAPATYRCSG